MITILSFFGGFVVFSALRMANVPLTLFEGLVWLFLAIGVVIAMGYISVYTRLKHQTDADEAEIYCDGIIRRGLITRDNFMLGFTHIRELKIDWEDKMLTNLEGSKLFDKVKQDIFRKEAVEDFHARRMLKFSNEDLKYKTKKGKITNRSVKTEVEKELTEQALLDTERVLDNLSKNPEKKSVIELPFKNMTLTNVDKNKLKTYRYYFGLLKDEEHFPDQTIGFDRAFLMMPGEKEKLLQGYKRLEYHEEYPIFVKTVLVRWNCLTFVLDNIPFLILRDSENLDDDQTQQIITAEEIKYLQTQALVHLLNVKRGEEIQRELKTDRLEAMYEKAVQDHHLLIQDIRKRKRQLTENTGDQDEVKRLQNKLLTKAKLNYIAFAAIIVLVFILFFLLFALAPSTTSAQAPSAPTAETNLPKTIFELFLFSKKYKIGR